MDVQPQIKDIYNHLVDDLSKKIFENRLLYSLTGSHRFIENISSHDLEKLNNLLNEYNDIIVYGAGFLGGQLFSIYNRIAAFCDSNKRKQKEGFRGLKVISPTELKKYVDSTIVIAVLTERDIIEITNNLLNAGFSGNQILVYQKIAETLDFEIKPHMQYFDSGIILPHFSAGEVFADCGCFNCATSAQFIQYCNNYKSIIAFEPTPEQYIICQDKSKDIRDITIHPYGLWNENKTLSFDTTKLTSAHITDKSNENTLEIEVIKLDDILNDEGVTYIKMDIEGAELNALRGAEQTILKYHPKLAICVYHKPEDIWEIPSYILSLHSDYKLYFRHYSLGAGETVIYAI